MFQPSGASMIYAGCAQFSTLSFDDVSRLRPRRTHMQLKMPFLEIADASEQEPSAPNSTPTSPPPAAWDRIDVAARGAALGVLARLIARMLAARAATEVRHD
jgi:hypothetical protein